MTSAPETSIAATHAEEVRQGNRFAFGENWQRFLSVLDDARIAEADAALRSLLGVDDLVGRTFLDAGSGSGLHSLVASRLGAGKVHSFDFDPASVACTQELRRRHGSGPEWTVEHGSVRDDDYVGRLGSWDIVYSWGVLHHTGDMHHALANVARLVAPGGRLVISIYNDQGMRSRLWKRLKRVYNGLPASLRTPYAVLVMLPREMLFFGMDTAAGNPGGYIRSWTQYRARGMSRWHDLIDWVGGYPFEVAGPDEIFDFYKQRGFSLEHLETCGGGLGCNQYVFVRAADEVTSSDSTTRPRLSRIAPSS